MPKRTTQSDLELFSDLMVFRDVARRLEHGSVSMNSIGDAIGIKKDKLRRTLDRLDERFECNLVVRVDRSGSANRLSSEGRELAAKLSDSLSIVDWKPRSKRAIRIVASQTLFTADVLTRVLRKKLQDPSEVSIQVEMRSVLDFGSIVTELMDDLDLAIVWGVRQRTENKGFGIDYHLIGPLIDVVIISHNQRLLNESCQRVGADGHWVKSAFHQRRIAIMDSQNQVLCEEIPLPERDGLHIACDTISAQIACVTAGIADYAIVPAVYSELTPLYRDGRLYYSPRIGGVQLAAFSRSPGPHKIPRLAKLVADIHDDLVHNWVNRTQLWRDYEPMEFPANDLKFFQDMKFGYYIDWPRGERSKDEEFVPSWRWERVELTLEQTAEVPLATFSGRIRNSSGDNFIVRAELSKNVFSVKAHCAEELVKSSVEEFVSVFTWCDPLKKVMFGSWGGTDPDNYPAVFGTIWSHRELKGHQLKKIAAMAQLRSALESDRDHDLKTEIPPLSS